VAAGVIGNALGEVLVAKRSEGAHQGGLWEFPGGKLESGEATEAGLARELAEEIGITLDSARPLIRVHHAYPERAVLLDVWWVTGWHGRIYAREGQELCWQAVDSLLELPMPAADVPVVAALRLPDRYLITPSPGNDRQAFLTALGASIEAGVRLVALRAKELSRADLMTLSRQAADICRAGGARMLINGDPTLLDASGADGVHLDSARLMAAKVRPIPAAALLAAACHDARELAQAARVGVDFAVLSPLAATPGHAQTLPLGWQRFQQLVERVNLPVFALGGMGPEQVRVAWNHGGQGIAAVRALWKGSLTAGSR